MAAEVDEQKQCVETIRKWIETEVEVLRKNRIPSCVLYLDDTFIVLYLKGCKYDLEKVKKKITAFYENRRKIPQWWANRSLEDDEILKLAKLK
ncbi:hypothetical protein CHUAL_001126 [Chamberlinius hualienensis]